MPNRTSQPRTDAQPLRAPAKRAQGLDPEITAQPRPVSDDIALEEPGLADGLSVDPEELGSRFLSEAVEQGNYSSEPSSQADASLFEPPAGDEPLVSPNFEADRTIWEQTVDLSLQSGGNARDLRAPAFVPNDDFEERGRAAVEEMKTAPVDLQQSATREVSLFDREGNEGDETIAPDVDTEDAGAPPREEPRARDARTESLRGLADATTGGDPARGPNFQRPRGWLFDAARFALLATASVLRVLARWMTPAEKHSPAVPRRKRRSNGIEERSTPHLPIG